MASNFGETSRTSPSRASNSSSTASVWPAFSVDAQQRLGVDVGDLLDADVGGDLGRGAGVLGSDIGAIGHGIPS